MIRLYAKATFEYIWVYLNQGFIMLNTKVVKSQKKGILLDFSVRGSKMGVIKKFGRYGLQTKARKMSIIYS